MSVIPPPFGFGLWTAHFTPGIMGCPTVVTERFDAGAGARSDRALPGDGPRAV